MREFVMWGLVPLLLLTPTIWELIDDAKGDVNKKADVLTRGLLVVIISMLINTYTGKPFIDITFFSIALHFFIFDYGINIILGRSPWFGYLGKKGVIDNIEIWRRLNPWVRFIIRSIVLGSAIFIYLK